MTLRPLLCAALLAAAGAGPALADDHNLNVALFPDASMAGSFSAGWGVTHLMSGAFTDTFSFAPDVGGTLSAALTSYAFMDSADIDFTSVMVDGQAFDMMEDGALDLASIGPVVVNAPIVITVMGIAAPMMAAGNAIAASYSGSVSISAVPEPQTYALMLAGLGALAFAARRRIQR